MFKKRELLLFSKDRFAMFLLATLFLSVIAVALLTFFNMRISDVQVPNRYSDYGFTNLYRGKWYTLTFFAIFGLVTFVTNGYLAIKLHEERRGLTLGILAISLVIMAFTLAVTIEVFRLAAFSL